MKKTTSPATHTATTIFKIRVTGEVLETATATRQHKVDGQVLTFGREPIYLRAEKLPQKLTSDPYLEITPVDAPPPGTIVTELKAERVQEE